MKGTADIIFRTVSEKKVYAMNELEASEHKRVSVISPTYNGKKYLDNFLHSILDQTYNNIEFIIIDDGSSDGSSELLQNYRNLFSARGYSFTYIRQSHAGQAVAINNGLKKFSGDFLMWIDSDDMLEKECIAKMVTLLENSPEAGFAVSDSRYVQFGVKEEGYIFGRYVDAGRDDYFFDLLRGKHNYSLGCGTALVRREVLCDAIPDLHIFESPEGQNLQLMLPITYHSRCVYLHEPLHIRVVHADSHCHKERSYKEEIIRQYNFVDLIRETISKMHIPEEKAAVEIAEKRFAHRILALAYANRDMREFFKQSAYLRFVKDFSPDEKSELAAVKTLHFGKLSRIMYRWKNKRLMKKKDGICS